MVKFFIGLTFTIGCLIMACNNLDSNLNSNIKDSLMLINASPDAGAINIAFNNQIKNPIPLAFMDNTSYVLIDKGNLKQVVTTVPPSSIEILSIPMLLKSSTAYSIFFTGQIIGGNAQYVATADSLKNPNRNRAKYRFINLSQDSRTLDLRLLSNDSILIPNIPFGAASNFNQIKPAKYTFKIISRDTNIKITDTITHTLSNGKIYTFWAKGLVKGADKKALGIKIIQNK